MFTVDRLPEWSEVTKNGISYLKVMHDIIDDEEGKSQNIEFNEMDDLKELFLKLDYLDNLIRKNANQSLFQRIFNYKPIPLNFAKLIDQHAARLISYYRDGNMEKLELMTKSGVEVPVISSNKRRVLEEKEFRHFPHVIPSSLDEESLIKLIDREARLVSSVNVKDPDHKLVWNNDDLSFLKVRFFRDSHIKLQDEVNFVVEELFVYIDEHKPYAKRIKTWHKWKQLEIDGGFEITDIAGSITSRIVSKINSGDIEEIVSFVSEFDREKNDLDAPELTAEYIKIDKKILFDSMKKEICTQL